MANKKKAAPKRTVKIKRYNPDPGYTNEVDGEIWKWAD
jgi:hypothetical protein